MMPFFFLYTRDLSTFARARLFSGYKNDARSLFRRCSLYRRLGILGRNNVYYGRTRMIEQWRRCNVGNNENNDDDKLELL